MVFEVKVVKPRGCTPRERGDPVREREGAPLRGVTGNAVGGPLLSVLCGPRSLDRPESHCGFSSSPNGSASIVPGVGPLERAPGSILYNVSHCLMKEPPDEDRRPDLLTFLGGLPFPCPPSNGGLPLSFLNVSLIPDGQFTEPFYPFGICTTIDFSLHRHITNFGSRHVNKVYCDGGYPRIGFEMFLNDGIVYLIDF